MALYDTMKELEAVALRIREERDLYRAFYVASMEHPENWAKIDDAQQAIQRHPTAAIP